MFAPKIHLLISTLLTIAACATYAQAPSAQPGELPIQARQVEGVLVPVPKQVFESLDKFHGANWRAVERPEILRWKPPNDQVQTALLLGVVVAEGFVAMEAKDAKTVRKVGRDVLILARGLGVEKTALRRSRSIMEHADKGDWPTARKEWDGVLSDLENGMIALKSEHLSQLVSLSGWLRGTGALCAIVLQNYSMERARLIQQPVLVDYLYKQVMDMTELQGKPAITKMEAGLAKIRSLTNQDNGVMTEQTVREIGSICNELVRISSDRQAAADDHRDQSFSKHAQILVFSFTPVKKGRRN